MKTLVMVFAQIKPNSGDAFEAAFREVSRTVRGTDGHLDDRLVRDADDPDRYVLIGEWESTEKFLAWEDAPVHRETTVPMRQFWAGPVQRQIYETAVAEVRGDG
jgi:heme-degrading monooxygenase HmoA